MIRSSREDEGTFGFPRCGAKNRYNFQVRAVIFVWGLQDLEMNRIHNNLLYTYKLILLYKN